MLLLRGRLAGHGCTSCHLLTGSWHGPPLCCTPGPALTSALRSPTPQVRAIADLELAKTAERVRERGIALEVSTALMQRIVAEGYNEAMGARELRRAVVHLVDDPLSDALLRGEVSSPGRGPATAARPPRPPPLYCLRSTSRPAPSHPPHARAHICPAPAPPPPCADPGRRHGGARLRRCHWPHPGA